MHDGDCCITFCFVHPLPSQLCKAQLLHDKENPETERSDQKQWEDISLLITVTLYSPSLNFHLNICSISSVSSCTMNTHGARQTNSWDTTSQLTTSQLTTSQLTTHNLTTHNSQTNSWDTTSQQTCRRKVERQLFLYVSHLLHTLGFR